MKLSERISKEALMERLQSKKELESFINKINNVLTWVDYNPENSENIRFSEAKLSVRGQLLAAWEGY